jgi:hypothetical protein
VAALSQQLRRFLDDQAWLENRRIMDILHSVENKVLSLRDAPPAGSIMEIAEAHADVELAMERPLFTPTMKPVIANLSLQMGDEDIDPSALFDQVVVDKARLMHHVRRALQDKPQITLRELVATQPLLHGLAELVAYLQIGSDAFGAITDEGVLEPIHWQALAADGELVSRYARLPRVIFIR